jgi:NAD(P)-dependent dehydrogenase (short-subunit alcohol dehydrogenase family)
MSAMNGDRLKGRNCLIVGGTGGIGLGAARRFLDEGARVVVSGMSPGLEPAVLSSLGPSDRITQIATDIREEEDVLAMFRSANAFFEGRLDVLLHVAGISGRRFGDGKLGDCTLQGWDRVMEINARGVFLTNREAVRVMIAQTPDEMGIRGSVVNVGSVLAASPSPRFFGTIAYAASKGAIRSLTLSAASAYASERIRFNLIEPGLIDTPMAARAARDPSILAFLASKQPLSGGPGMASDVSEAALYLSEPASRFLTGVVLNVDGGWSVSEGQYPS